MTSDLIRRTLDSVPDEWLASPAIATDFAGADEARDRYASYLETRMTEPRAFVAEADQARERLSRMPAQRLKARR